jgi:hypothetical protein
MRLDKQGNLMDLYSLAMELIVFMSATKFC